MNAQRQARRQAQRESIARCPACGRPAVLSGNYANCHNRTCTGGQKNKTWQGRIEDVWYGDWENEL